MKQYKGAFLSVGLVTILIYLKEQEILSEIKSLFSYEYFGSLEQILS